MNILLWICQGLLALVFLVSGALKATQTKARMIETGQTGVRDYPLGFIRFIAVSEIAGAVAMIAPLAVGILPILTPLAAIGLGVIQIGAAHAHSRLHEPKNVATNAVLLALCAIVAIGRFTGH